MKQLLKSIRRRRRWRRLSPAVRVLVVDETLGKIRRAEPLPDFDLEDIQARTVVAENGRGADRRGRGEGVHARRRALAEKQRRRRERERRSKNERRRSKNERERSERRNFEKKRHALDGPPRRWSACATRTCRPPPVCARRPRAWTWCASPLARRTAALIEIRTRELAELAVRLKNDDKDWRHGLRVRLLVKNVKAAAKKKKQREERAQRDEGRRRRRRRRRRRMPKEKTDKEKTSRLPRDRSRDRPGFGVEEEGQTQEGQTRLLAVGLRGGVQGEQTDVPHRGGGWRRRRRGRRGGRGRRAGRGIRSRLRFRPPPPPPPPCAHDAGRDTRVRVRGRDEETTARVPARGSTEPKKTKRASRAANGRRDEVVGVETRRSVFRRRAIDRRKSP